MNITFYCPKCRNLCAFEEKYAGRTARCMKCQERFTIPSKDFEKAEIIKDFGEKPVPGFFQSVFKRSWRAFFCIGGVTTVVLITFLAILRFYLADVDLTVEAPGFNLLVPLGWIVIFFSWGIQFWLYMEIIGDTSLEYDELLNLDLGFGFEFFGTLIKSIYLFVCACLIALLPFVLLGNLLRWAGIESPWVLTPLMFGGFILFPMVILILSTGQEMYLVFRLDYLVRPILKAPKAYSVLVFFVVCAGFLEWSTTNYDEVRNRGDFVIYLHLTGNIAAALVGIAAMRAIGLFGRHFPCYLQWLQ